MTSKKTPVQPEKPNEVRFRYCPLYWETYRDTRYLIKEEVTKFLLFKSKTPLEKYDAHDTPLKGVFREKIPGIWHAHLANDINIVYRISGRNPTLIYLYGMFSHETLGTGKPSNPNRQKQSTQRFTQQSFIVPTKEQDKTQQINIQHTVEPQLGDPKFKK